MRVALELLFYFVTSEAREDPLGPDATHSKTSRPRPSYGAKLTSVFIDTLEKKKKNTKPEKKKRVVDVYTPHRDPGNRRLARITSVANSSFSHGEDTTRAIGVR